MFLLNTTMLRERFTLHEGGPDSPPMIALGNRITLPLISNDGEREERLVVRAHNMHTTLRMAAMICRSYRQEGPLLTRQSAYPWAEEWKKFIPAYERTHNPNLWVAVFSGGRAIFKQGNYHPFLDVIEQCDARNRDEYDRALTIAEDAFNIAGRGVRIEHDTTIALVIGALMHKTRIGLIFRNPRRSTTFNFSVEPRKADQSLTRDQAIAEPYQCLMLAAAWLELIQLAVNTGFFQAKRGHQMAGAPSIEAAQERIGKLNAEITQFEKSYAVIYRPDRPDLNELINEATSFAQGAYAQPL